MAIKKAFQPLMNLLTSAVADNLSVADIIEQATELVSAKSGGGGGATTFHKNEEGTVIAVFDYYFQKWMSPLVVEYGAKATSASGLNSMCKEGVSNWTKQQRQAKNEKDNVLTDVANGEILAEDVADALADIEARRQEVLPHSEGHGYDTLEELLASLEEQAVA